MVTSFNSVQELMSSCANSELKSHVSIVLRKNKYIKWNMVSCSDNGDRCSSEFASPIDNSDRKHHLSCEVTPEGEYHHYSVI